MKCEEIQALGKIEFAYNQFLILDSSIDAPGSAWTDTHLVQGFARRERCVSFLTLLEYGIAHVTIRLGPYRRIPQHLRVIEVPIEIPTGRLFVGGPEEFPEFKLFSTR